MSFMSSESDFVELNYEMLRISEHCGQRINCQPMWISPLFYLGLNLPHLFSSLREDSLKNKSLREDFIY